MRARSPALCRPRSVCSSASITRWPKRSPSETKSPSGSMMACCTQGGALLQQPAQQMRFAGARIALHQKAGRQQLLEIERRRGARGRVSHLDRNGHGRLQALLSQRWAYQPHCSPSSAHGRPLRVAHNCRNAGCPDGRSTDQKIGWRPKRLPNRFFSLCATQKKAQPCRPNPAYRDLPS